MTPEVRRIQVGGEHFYAVRAVEVLGEDWRYIPTVAILRVTRGALEIEEDGWYPLSVHPPGATAETYRLVSVNPGIPVQVRAAALQSIALLEDTTVQAVIRESAFRASDFNRERQGKLTETIIAGGIERPEGDA